MVVNRFRIQMPTSRGFTLAELMISIALVLLLMLGINQVFRVTGEAVGTNQAISTALRDARAAQAVMSRDFNAWAIDSPAIIIRSQRVSAFRNRADELADRDWDPTILNDGAKLTVDLDGDGVEGNSPGEVIPPAIYNHRSHRIDMLSFFGRELFNRQTGGAFDAGGALHEEYVADMSATDAWIWYGHLRRPDERTPSAGNPGYEHRDPGENFSPPIYNDRNFYATDFVLGRMPVLLREGNSTPTTPGDVIEDRTPRRQRFIARRDPFETFPGSGMTDTLAPLEVVTTPSGVQLGTRSNETVTADQWPIESSRYDLANTSIEQFRVILRNYQAAYNAGLVPAWYHRMSNWRFQGDPQPLRPLTARSVARTTPAFVEHCTQFIVEYAGDFLHQHESDGSLTPGPITGTSYEQDGQIDYLIDNSVPGQPVRRIRWYGMPRDVAGNLDGGGPDGIIRTGASAGGDPNRLVDVVPLRDVLGPSFVYTPPPGSPNEVFIERAWPDRPIPPGPGPMPPPLRATYTEPGGMRPDGQYIVAWGPDTGNQPRPKLIRIVITIDDPQGRIAEGQTFEYVFRVGG